MQSPVRPFVRLFVTQVYHIWIVGLSVKMIEVRIMKFYCTVASSL